MEDVAALLGHVKRELRARRLTYRHVATRLGLSEASVKRLFSNGQITLPRLAEVAALMDLTLSELMQGVPGDAPLVDRLSLEQEAELVSDHKLLLVAVCALNHWTLQDIVQVYALRESECVLRLTRLDRLGLVDLLPGNRVRLKVARTFSWLPGGPIQRFFREHGQGPFLDAPFAGAGEAHVFVHGMLTRAAAGELQKQIYRLRQQFEALHQESLSQPRSRRHGTGLLMAAREWEIPAFAKFRRPEAR
jgi:transcriptional regulator with XRE-family HTH domain